VKNILAAVIEAVEAEGGKLAEEFHLPQGPRGSRGNAPIDTEIEERLREKLQKLLPATFAGEETGTTPGSEKGWTWLVDPQDGTSEFLSGRRGSAGLGGAAARARPGARCGARAAPTRPRPRHHRLGRGRERAAAQRRAGRAGPFPAHAGAG